MSLANQTVVFTGFRNEELANKISSLGGIYHPRVVKAINILVMKDESYRSRPAAAKAGEYGANIITLKQFMNTYFNENNTPQTKPTKTKSKTTKTEPKTKTKTKTKTEPKTETEPKTKTKSKTTKTETKTTKPEPFIIKTIEDGETYSLKVPDELDMYLLYTRDLEEEETFYRLQTISFRDDDLYELAERYYEDNMSWRMVKVRAKFSGINDKVHALFDFET